MRAAPLGPTLAVAFLLLAGCASGPAADSVLLVAGGDSGYRSDGPTPWVLLLGDEASWHGFWRQHTSNRPAEDGRPPMAPEVDFERYAVLVVVAGVRATAGYRVELDVGLPGPDEAAKLDVTLLRPGMGCKPAAAETAPFAAHLVPRASIDLAARPKVTYREVAEPCAT